VLIVRRPRGFSLIEMMIAIALVGVLMAIGIPAFRTWTGNAQIRTGAEGVISGLQIARNEAVRRNVNVQFQMQDDPAPLPANFLGWNVSIESDGTIIQQRSGNEGSKSAIATVLPAGVDTVTFTGLGRLRLDGAGVPRNQDNSLALQFVDVTSQTLSAADSRALRIEIDTSGLVRMCDPKVVAASDTRICRLPHP
jgi:type IV fimbrial biogenesis protein FimT